MSGGRLGLGKRNQTNKQRENERRGKRESVCERGLGPERRTERERARERERERDSERDREREGEKASERERERGRGG